MRCVFAKGSCQTCGKSESQGHALCFYDDPFFFKCKKKKANIIAPKLVSNIYPKYDTRNYFSKNSKTKRFGVAKPRGRVSKTDRAFVFKRDNNECLSCDSKENLTIDHIIPVSKGGKNERGNYQTLCYDCNTSKGDRTRNYINLKKITIPELKEFDPSIVEQLKYNGWWDIANNKPFNSLIVGDSSTTVNLGWFIEVKLKYYLTEDGSESYYNWLINNNKL